MLAFLFSKVGAYLIGAVVIVALVGGGYWYVKHQQAKIAGLEEKVAGLELRAEVIERAQKSTDAFMKKKTAIQARVVKERANVDQVVESGDDPAMRDLFIRNRLLEDNRNNPPGGASGRATNPPGR